jgi:hypothetical protein
VRYCKHLGLTTITLSCCTVFNFLDAPRSSAMTRQFDLRQKNISIVCLEFGGNDTKTILRCLHLLSCVKPNTTGSTNSYHKNIHTNNQTRSLSSGARMHAWSQQGLHPGSS